MSVTTAIKCQSKNPAYCRYHGDSKKIAFEKRLEKQLKDATEKFEALRYTGDADETLEAMEFLEEAKIEYAATVHGEELLREEIANAVWPEVDVLKHRLDTALKIRAEQEDEDSEEGVYTFPASKLEEAQKRIDKANRKLERAGVEERFTYTTEEFIEEDEDGNKFSMIQLQMSHPSLNVAGWDFVAAVDRTPDGEILTRVLPGQELNGVRPEAQVCEHCGSDRRRKATYLLRNGEGDFKQVGSNCLESFLGVTPKALWALNYDIEEVGKISSDRSYGGADTILSLHKTVAYALAVSNGGNDFTTRGSAQEYGVPSTADDVRNQFFNSKLLDRDRVDPEPYYEQAKQIIEGTPIEGDSDYATNMRTILKSDNLGVKQLGMAVSVIAAHNREKWKAEKELAKANEVKSIGFLGATDEKIKDIQATIKRIDHYDSDFGTKTRLIMTAPDGKEIVWTASKFFQFDKGDQIKIKSAKIKGHGNFNGNDQTILTGARVDETELTS